MKVINVKTDLLRQVAPGSSDAYKALAQNALASRELFSYKFPARGLKGEEIPPLPDFGHIIETCRLFAEVAQLMSECVETEFAPLAQPYGDFGEYPLRRYFEYKHRSGVVEDEGDHYRLGRVLKKGAPVSLASTATEGL